MSSNCTVNASSEAELVEHIYCGLLRSNAKVRKEVPILGNYADIVLKQGDTIIAIECKLSNWKRALKQSLHHRGFVNLAYVCMPSRQLSEQMRNEFAHSQVGLIFPSFSTDWPWRVEIPAGFFPTRWPVIEARIDYYLSKGIASG